MTTKAIIAFPATELPLSVRRRLAVQLRAWRGDDSQQTIADVCGVSRAQVGNWENDLQQSPDVAQIWILEAFKAGFSAACGVRVVSLGTPRRASSSSRSKPCEPVEVCGTEPANGYEALSLMFEQLSAQTVEHSVSTNERLRLSGDTAVAMLQGLRAAAAELLDVEYMAQTEGERSALTESILGRLCAVADGLAKALEGKDMQPAVFVTPAESRAILADCLSLCANDAA